MYHQRFKSEGQKFAEKYTVEPNGCWVWKADKGAGYPGFRVSGQHQRAHRYIWQKANGRALVAGECVCHACDNPRCVNPVHLFVGSHSDNMKDRSRKGRFHCRGEDNPRAKVTRQVVADIRAQYAKGGIRQVDLGKQYGIAQNSVSKIVNQTTWIEENAP